MNKIHDELKVDACTTIQCLFFNIPLIHRQVHDKQQPRSPFSRVLVFLFLIYGVLCTALNQNNRLTDAGNYTHRIRIKKESFIQSFPFSNNCFRSSAFLLVMLEYGVYSLSFFLLDIIAPSHGCSSKKASRFSLLRDILTTISSQILFHFVFVDIWQNKYRTEL